nr:hypothetical protein Iba_chr07aCG15330 [Ipomoea batatas]
MFKLLLSFRARCVATVYPSLYVRPLVEFHRLAHLRAQNQKSPGHKPRDCNSPRLCPNFMIDIANIFYVQTSDCPVAWLKICLNDHMESSPGHSPISKSHIEIENGFSSSPHP